MPRSVSLPGCEPTTDCNYTREDRGLIINNSTRYSALQCSFLIGQKKFIVSLYHFTDAKTLVAGLHYSRSREQSSDIAPPPNIFFIHTYIYFFKCDPNMS